MVWTPKKFPKSWKKNYGTVRAYKNRSSYIHINRISKDDSFRKAVLKSGLKYEIASNKFGSSHHKTLASATSFAKKLMKPKKKK